MSVAGSTPPTTSLLAVHALVLLVACAPADPEPVGQVGETSSDAIAPRNASANPTTPKYGTISQKK